MPYGSVVETFGKDAPYEVLQRSFEDAMKNLVERVLLLDLCVIDSFAHIGWNGKRPLSRGAFWGLARAGGLEPPTSGLLIQCSQGFSGLQLSYAPKPSKRLVENHRRGALLMTDRFGDFNATG